MWTEADYDAYYLAQLKEILSNPAYGNVGKFTEVWMDGGRAQKVNYNFETWFETIRDLQGDCLISQLKRDQYPLDWK